MNLTDTYARSPANIATRGVFVNIFFFSERVCVYYRSLGANGDFTS